MREVTMQAALTIVGVERDIDLDDVTKHVPKMSTRAGGHRLQVFCIASATSPHCGITRGEFR
jgi:hypothetical protein